jgi:hypothetical protein
MPNDKFSRVVFAINCAETKSVHEASKYYNKRAEMWGNLKEWFCDDGDVSIPDDSEFLRQLCSQEYDYKNHGKLILTSKKSDNLPSPDKADALALTFAVPKNALYGDNLDVIKKINAYHQYGYMPQSNSIRQLLGT